MGLKSYDFFKFCYPVAKATGNSDLCNTLLSYWLTIKKDITVLTVLSNKELIFYIFIPQNGEVMVINEK